MRFVSVTVQAFGIGKDGVGEVVVFVDEEIHFLSGTFALRNQIVQLVDSPVLFVQSFSDTLWQEVGIDFTEEVEADLAMCIQSFSIIVQFAGDAWKVKVKHQIAVAVYCGMLPDVEVAE